MAAGLGEAYDFLALANVGTAVHPQEILARPAGFLAARFDCWFGWWSIHTPDVYLTAAPCRVLCGLCNTDGSPSRVCGLVEEADSRHRCKQATKTRCINRE